MDSLVRSMTCRFGACCSSALNCPWWHSVEELKIFNDEKELQQRKLAVRCGFCARGECRFGADCKRAKRVAVMAGGEDKQKDKQKDKQREAPGAGGEATSAAVVKADSGNGRTAEKKTVGSDGRR